MKLTKLLGRDVRLGTVRNIHKFLIVIALAAFICDNTYTSYIEFFGKYGIIRSNGTFMDYLMKLNPGIEIYHFSPKEEFKIPVFWFTMQITVHYIIGYYPEEDFRLYGKTVIPASGSSGLWWISKCIWCTLTVTLYYVIMTATAFAVSLYRSASVKGSFTKALMSRLYGGIMNYITIRDALLIVVIVPFATTLSLCLFQLFLGFVITPVVSYIIICIFYVLSVYYHSWWFSGGFTMWIRSSYINISEGRCYLHDLGRADSRQVIGALQECDTGYVPLSQSKSLKYFTN